MHTMIWLIPMTNNRFFRFENSYNKLSLMHISKCNLCTWYHEDKKLIIHFVLKVELFVFSSICIHLLIMYVQVLLEHLFLYKSGEEKQ